VASLIDLPSHDEAGALRIVVETPRGAALKFRYDEKLQIFTVGRALPLGLTYPFDWGFIPSTLAPDGDPLDALVLHDSATYPGVVLQCRPLGVVELSQKSEGRRQRQRNDRVVAMPLWHDRLGEFERATDLPRRIRAEIELFFLSGTFFTEKDPQILGWSGPRKAEALVRAAKKQFDTRSTEEHR
jgi:inorganic pyrophosphatase